MEQMIINTRGARMGKLISASRGVEMVLFSGDLFKLDGDNRAMCIQCLDGNLWITQQGDAADYLLEPGESFIVTHSGQVLVQGQPEGKLIILPSQPSNN